MVKTNIVSEVFSHQNYSRKNYFKIDTTKNLKK